MDWFVPFTIFQISYDTLALVNALDCFTSQGTVCLENMRYMLGMCIRIFEPTAAKPMCTMSPFWPLTSFCALPDWEGIFTENRDSQLQVITWSIWKPQDRSCTFHHDVSIYKTSTNHT